jgi:hypothetical protein
LNGSSRGRESFRPVPCSPPPAPSQFFFFRTTQPGPLSLETTPNEPAPPNVLISTGQSRRSARRFCGLTQCTLLPAPRAPSLGSLSKRGGSRWQNVRTAWGLLMMAKSRKQDSTASQLYEQSCRASLPPTLLLLLLLRLRCRLVSPALPGSSLPICSCTYVDATPHRRDSVIAQARSTASSLMRSCTPPKKFCRPVTVVQ